MWRMNKSETILGLIIVDHGSRLPESNQLVVRVSQAFQQRFADQFSIVEPAHMELAEPSICMAYQRCVERGAQQILVIPYFLGPGKHWTTDIPSLVAQAATNYPETQWTLAAPLGLDDLMLDLLLKRAQEAIGRKY